MDPIAYAIAGTVSPKEIVAGSEWVTSYAERPSVLSAHGGRQGRAYLLSNGRILVMRGWIPQTYNPVSNTWTTQTTCPFGSDVRSFGISQLLDGRVVRTGGLGGSPVSYSTIFNPATNTWAVGPELVEFTHSHSQVTLDNGDVMIMGGQAGPTDTGLTASLKTWILPGGTGSPVRKADQPKFSSKAIAINIPSGLYNGGQYGNRVVVFNNNTATAGYGTNETWMYDVTSDTWSTKANVVAPTPALGGAMVLPNGVVVLMGGEPIPASDGEGFYLPNHEGHLYDTSTNLWDSPVPNFTTPEVLATSFQEWGGDLSWHLWPVLLPDGRTFLSYAAEEDSSNRQGFVSLASGRIMYLADSIPRTTLLAYLAST